MPNNIERYALNKNGEGYTDPTALEGIKRADKDLKNKAKKEIWKPIKDFEGYEVSNMGNVRSLNYKRTGEIKILKPQKDKNGYLIVNLYKNRKLFHKKVHRLVAGAFIPNPKRKTQVNHKDGDKQNNKISNLEWTTCKENIIHCHETGLWKPKYGNEHYNYGKCLSEKTKQKMREQRKGELNSNSKRVICITTGETFRYIREAARQYNVAAESIGRVCKGRSKTAGRHPVTGEKLKWEYVED